MNLFDPAQFSPNGPVSPQHLVAVEKDEARGIRCTQRKVLLAIRDDVGGTG